MLSLRGNFWVVKRETLASGNFCWLLRTKWNCEAAKSHDGYIQPEKTASPGELARQLTVSAFVKLNLLFVPLTLCLVGCNADVEGAAPDATATFDMATKNLTPGEEIEHGVWRSEVVLPVGGDAPRAWVYRPTAALKVGTKKRFPCVFIAPAGTDVAGGVALRDDERATHIPYVRAGMLVVAYEINGLSGDKAVAARDFESAHFGLDNANAAVSWALQNVPHVDPSRLFAVGHSSAGALALEVAQHDARIRACAAYAPACNFVWPDPGGSVLDIAAREDDEVPGFSSALRAIMPQSNLNALKCPLFLFCCDDDTIVNPLEVRGFANSEQTVGKKVTLLTQPTGGHVHGMKQNGIPAAIAWLKAFHHQKKFAATPNSTP